MLSVEDGNRMQVCDKQAVASSMQAPVNSLGAHFSSLKTPLSQRKKGAPFNLYLLLSISNSSRHHRHVDFPHNNTIHS